MFTEKVRDNGMMYDAGILQYQEGRRLFLSNSNLDDWMSSMYVPEKSLYSIHASQKGIWWGYVCY